jgi:hypothetical protein
LTIISSSRDPSTARLPDVSNFSIFYNSQTPLSGWMIATGAITCQ